MNSLRDAVIELRDAQHGTYASPSFFQGYNEAMEDVLALLDKRKFQKNLELRHAVDALKAAVKQAYEQ